LIFLLHALQLIVFSDGVGRDVAILSASLSAEDTVCQMIECFASGYHFFTLYEHPLLLGRSKMIQNTIFRDKKIIISVLIVMSVSLEITLKKKISLKRKMI